MQNNKQNQTTRQGARMNAAQGAAGQSDTEFAADAFSASQRSKSSPATGSVSKIPNRKG